MALTQEDLDQIGTMINGAIGQATQEVKEVQAEPKDQPKVIVPDAYLQSLLDAKKAVIDKVVKNGADIVYVRGRRGTVEVNRTKDTLNMLDDQINDWKDRKTHKPVK
tara:strand:- start:142 stop:462 length:321 start_codon:yes stop_codon:yes gene_type:complete